MLDVARPKTMRMGSMALAVLIPSLSFVFVSTDQQRTSESEVATWAPVEEVGLPAHMPDLSHADELRDEILWLARAIYSETKRPYEQELVAWVVRNRVETRYRGAGSYRAAVLDPWQFSAFNTDSPRRSHYMNLDEASRARGWTTAVNIAYDVMNAPRYERPFEIQTRHFYSERSMVGRSQPEWAHGHLPVSLDRDVDPRRFRFYSAVW